MSIRRAFHRQAHAAGCIYRGVDPPTVQRARRVGWDHRPPSAGPRLHSAAAVPVAGRCTSPALMGTAVVATLSLGQVLLHNVYPPAGAPYNLLPPIFAGLLLAASAWFLSSRRTVADDVVVDLDAREGEAPVPTHEHEVVSD